MSEAREFWLSGGGVFLTQEEAEAYASQWDGHPAYLAIRVREVVGDEGQPAEPVQQKPVAWMAFGACTAAPIFSDTPPDDVNLAGWEPLYRHPQPDHAAELVDAVTEIPESVIDAVAEAVGSDAYYCGRVWSAWGVGTMGPDDFGPLCEESDRLADIALAAINAYRASLKGGA